VWARVLEATKVLFGLPLINTHMHGHGQQEHILGSRHGIVGPLPGSKAASKAL
jgi:hypothetical protein